jgi:Fe-S-cluster-containing dehydrogenase component
VSKYALVVEDEACWGCRTCEAACGQEYDFKRMLLRVAEDGPASEDNTGDYMYHVRMCRHCDDAPCIPACPESAFVKREDGLVILKAEQCTGCGNCLEACPYNVIWFDESKQQAYKCNMCHHRIDQGIVPACADNICLAHCIHFGDPAAIQAEIERRKNKRQTK